MPAVDGAEAPFRSGHSALVTLPDAKRRQALCTAHRSKWASTVTYWAICASASNSLTRDAHVTDDTARHLRYTSRAKREADVSLPHRCTMARHDATGVTTPRQTVKASPHRHKWMLTPGAPPDPSHTWTPHGSPVRTS